MPYEQKDNRGGLWKNEQKTTDNQPDFRGKIMVAGQMYWLSGWKRAADANPMSPALSVAVTPVQTQETQQRANEYAQQSGHTSPSPVPTQTELDDDIPF